MIDYGVFYEFIPMEDVGTENPHIVPLVDVELNKIMRWSSAPPADCGVI